MSQNVEQFALFTISRMLGEVARMYDSLGDDYAEKSEQHRAESARTRVAAYRIEGGTIRKGMLTRGRNVKTSFEADDAYLSGIAARAPEPEPDPMADLG